MFSRVFALHFLIRRDMAAFLATHRLRPDTSAATPISRLRSRLEWPPHPTFLHPLPLMHHRASLGRETSRAGVQDVLEFGFGIREQILLRVVLGEACFSGIRASVDLEIIEIFLFYGWEDWNWKSGIRRISPPIKLATKPWMIPLCVELTIYSDPIDCLIATRILLHVWIFIFDYEFFF